MSGSPFRVCFDVSNPHTFLTTEAAATRLTRFFLPRQRAFDNVQQAWEMPNEDEIATAMLTLRSQYLSFLFPHRAAFYDRYLTFRDVPPQEIEQWRSGLLLFLKKLTWKQQRPLILKSPPHTCRIRLLLELFPQAKFVHIHRNPYTVFQSSMHLVDTTVKLLCFQRHDQVDWQARTLRLYREMYDVFFEERGLIPSGHYHEVGFEQLEQDPIGQVHKLYESLSLPDFAQAEPPMQQYVDSIAGYKKNEFEQLAAGLREQIACQWRPCFDEWGYPI